MPTKKCKSDTFVGKHTNWFFLEQQCAKITMWQLRNIIYCTIKKNIVKVLTDSHIAFSVLISLGASSGSGFLYQSGKHVFLVTAKHVLFDELNSFRNIEIEILCQSKIRGFDSNTYRIHLNESRVEFHKRADVVIVVFGQINLPTDGKLKAFRTAKGVERIHKGQANPIIASKKDIELFDEVKISNEIFVSGYPTSLGIKESQQFDVNKPLLRRGIVANIYQNAKTIILDCPVYGGNSGGPVVQTTLVDGLLKVKIIGVISQFIPFVQQWKNDRDKLVHLEYLNSGYSVASSMDYVIELTKKIDES